MKIFFFKIFIFSFFLKFDLSFSVKGIIMLSGTMVGKAQRHSSVVAKTCYAPPPLLLASSPPAWICCPCQAFLVTPHWDYSHTINLTLRIIVPLLQIVDTYCQLYFVPQMFSFHVFSPLVYLFILSLEN